MNKVLKYLKDIGRLEPFEIKNSSFTFALAGPSTYIYVMIMLYYNPDLIIPYRGEIVFSVLFVVVGLIPYLKSKFLNENYGWVTFISLIIFQYYLTYTTALNNFSLDYLLVTYVFIFGSVLLLSNRLLVIIFSASQLIHLAYRVYYSELDRMSESAILVSMSTIFIFSFLVMNGLIRYRRNLEAVNVELENRIQERTLDLENRAKELLRKNKDLEEFAYVVSHDLKRPLRNIYTLTDWLTDDDEYEFNEEANQSLRLIKEQVTQMDLLVEGILNYSLQMDKEQVVNTVDAQALIKRIITVNSTETIDITLKERLPKVSFNESQLLQVFQNLIQNAIKHNDKKLVEIHIGYKKMKVGHQFSIQDNGPGIEKKYHGKIFELFQRLQINTEIDSIGIGLALVKKIIERNGGNIYVESELGKGTTFVFTIPA
ncbi:two-component sensor histidine kinase [Kordia sp. YSTF-M3]|uniref:histidine kinase n=1 Tax=Kordia aestuariivivens TaxID=2759037 RepID=A0ABR7QCB2_9FLAO|nr:ATP-binding protein [Kordia aestuariivivens]MBC8756006.1 two-component sensor histidine kinase [Kordia aestuariivivens]